jgi:DNA (cytosine-5)-methyltransferase 1
MTGLSLFSGIGGIDLAFEAAGGRIVAMCERDEFCRGILRRHWANVPIHEDIKALRGEVIGTVDIIFGGFPCQP